MPRAASGKIAVAPTCRFCDSTMDLEQGVVAASGAGRCCTNERRKAASDALGLRPIRPSDFDGPYLIRSGR